MGKKLVIKGADFSQVAVDTSFNPLNWFVNTVNTQCRDIPLGSCIAKSEVVNAPKTEVGMVSPVSGQGMLYYGVLSSTLSEKRFSTRQMVSLQTLYNNGYTSLKLTPKASSIIVVLYSTTPAISSTNPYQAGQMSYNNSTSQVTIPITVNTYVVFQAKPYTGVEITSNSSITDWVDIDIE